MAESFEILDQFPDFDTGGASTARDVMVVVTRTSAHGIEFERRYPRAQFKESIVQADAAGFTIVFEDLFTIPGVAAVIPGQRLNPANQLEEIVTVYYTSTSENSSNFTVVPFRIFTHAEVAKRVKAGRTVLDANEAA